MTRCKEGLDLLPRVTKNPLFDAMLQLKSQCHLCPFMRTMEIMHGLSFPWTQHINEIDDGIHTQTIIGVHKVEGERRGVQGPGSSCNSH